MNISFSGIGEQYVTFLSQNEEAGIPVAMSANGTVAAAANGSSFCGIAVSAKNDMNAVRTGGYVKLPYTGTAPAVGYTKLASNGSGGVTVSAANGREYLVVEVDTAAKTVGFFL